MALGVWSRSVGESVKLILQSGRPYGTDTHQQLREHLVAFLDAYNFAKHMESINPSRVILLPMLAGSAGCSAASMQSKG
jgi:hypothetical protein